VDRSNKGYSATYNTRIQFKSSTKDLALGHGKFRGASGTRRASAQGRTALYDLDAAQGQRYSYASRITPSGRHRCVLARILT
jgi:hypothetical protein